MSRRRDLAAFIAALGIAAVLGPLVLSGADLDHAAAAMGLAGAAAGAAIGLALGRPSLAPGALAGVGAYVSAGLAIRGVAVPAAVAIAMAATTVAAAAIALLTAHLDTVGLLAATLLITILLAAMTQALPDQTGGQAGLAGVPPLGTPLPRGAVLSLTPAGDFHALVVITLLVGLITAALLRGRAGALWRAVGSDRQRAAASGLHPLRTELLALSLGGTFAGLGGALSAHLGRIASPDTLSFDVVALPLLAALMAERGRVLGAIIAATVTGLVGGMLLPALNWHGPPSAMTLAVGLLAVAAVASLLPGGAGAPGRSASAIALHDPWPLEECAFDGAALSVAGLQVRAGPVVLARDFALSVVAGGVHAIVGPNGAGKTSLLRALAYGHPPQVRLLPPHGPVMLLPQSGGGFDACTVDESLFLSARGAGRTVAAANEIAIRWRDRLGLASSGRTLCADLSAGQRRLIDMARCLLARPSVLLCDEPLAGLDRSSRAAAESLLRAAAAAGLTIVFAEHDRGAVARLSRSSTELVRADLPAVGA